MKFTEDAIADLSHFRPHQAARHLLHHVPTALEDESVQTVHKRIINPKAKWDSFSYIYILSKTGKLKGVVSLKEFLASPKRKKMSVFKKRNIVVVHPHSPIQVAASRAILHSIKAVPVVDMKNTFMGQIGTDTILEVMEHEHVRDLLTATGVTTKNRSFKDVLNAKISSIVKWRTPWLLIGILGGYVTTMITRSFEGQLETVIELAFFIPVVLYMGAAVGNQTQMIYIRGITYQHTNTWQYLAREIIVDIIIGSILALGLGAFAYLSTGSFLVASIITSAIFLIGSTAGFIAVTVSAIFIKLKQDPAIGGGPFATIAQDIASILIYFLTATMFLL